MIATAELSLEYRKLQRIDPIKCGEFLWGLKERGLNHTEIAERLETNRHQVGRYLRIADWDQDIKAFIEKHRASVSNTVLLKAASRSLDKKETLSFLKEGGQKVPEREVPPNIPSPKRDFRKKVSKQKIKRVGHSNQLPGGLSWSDVGQYVSSPANVSLLSCIILLWGYLFHQGYIFFSAIDGDFISSLSSAFFSEAIPFIAAACLALSVKRSHKFLTGAILVGTILGVGLFMHASLENQLASTSGAAAQYEAESNAIKTSMVALSESIEALPSTYASKRQEMIAQLNQQRSELKAVTANVMAVESSHTQKNQVPLSYGAWIRIAAMLLNAFLVHLFFKRLSDDIGSGKNLLNLRSQLS